jgi:hypothetical protein
VPLPLKPAGVARPLLLVDRKIDGKTVTRTLTPEQASRYQPWFDDARQLRALTAQLEALSLKLAQGAEGWAEK